MLSALKMNEWKKNGNIIIRVIEMLGVGGKVKIELNPVIQSNIISIREVDLLERPMSETPIENKHAGFVITLTPFEAKTIELVID
jgi:hypothetical protein